jgi:hypothetical protein
MATRVAAVVIAAILALPAMARALTVDDFTRMATSVEADTEHGRGRDVTVLNVQSRFKFLRGSSEVGGRPTGRHRALGFFRDASRQAVTAVRERVVPKLGVWDLRKMRIGGPKKTPPILIAARPKGSAPFTGSATKSVTRPGERASKLARFTDPGRELMKRLQSQAKAKFRDRPTRGRK